MSKYIKKPIPVDAFLLGVDPMPEWFKESALINTPVDILFSGTEIEVKIKTLEGVMTANSGCDYIVRGVRGEMWPVKKDIFEETYEKMEE